MHIHLLEQNVTRIYTIECISIPLPIILMWRLSLPIYIGIYPLSSPELLIQSPLNPCSQVRKLANGNTLVPRSY